MISTNAQLGQKKRIDNYQFDNWILKISLFHDIDEFDFLLKKKKTIKS